MRIIAVLAIMAIASCGGSGTTTVKIAYLYAVGQGANAVVGLTVQNDGELAGLSVPQFSTNPIPVALAVTPNKNFIYVANSTSNTVSGYSLNHGSGFLTPVGTAVPPTPVGTNPIAVGVDSTGQFLFVLNQGSNNILTFSIDSVRGLLTAVGSPVTVPANSQFMVVSPNSAFLYVSAGTGISGFAIGPGGALSAVAGSPFTAGTDIRGMAIDSQGQFLYAADRGGNQVASFSIQGSGVLAAVSGSPFAAGTQPMMVTVDATGKLLYTANEGSNDVSAYTVSSGALTQVSGSPYGAAGSGVVTAAQPVFVTVDATNQFLYIANSGSKGIMAFTIKASDGTLTAVTNSPFGQVIAPQVLLSAK
ncbi:MAG TPA: beta-propeller fold lactonase family protein [Candidatus Angelobacter sp.]|nr:beta-propeller fold lactonase family protein [Candidatus Angelobacter sp.]